jgi:transposase
MKLMSTLPSKNYPPELRERAIRTVGEVRAEYTSDWAAVQWVATKLGIGAPQTLMNWVRRRRSMPGSVPG